MKFKWPLNNLYCCMNAGAGGQKRQVRVHSERRAFSGDDLVQRHLLARPRRKVRDGCEARPRRARQLAPLPRRERLFRRGL